MKKNKKEIFLISFILLFFVLLSFSCKNNRNHGLLNNGEDFIDTLTVTQSDLELILSYDELKSPSFMIIVENDLLVANNKIDTIIDRYSLDGKYEDSFLQKGPGPEEVTGLEMLQYARFDNSLYINEQPFLPLKVMKDMSSAHPKITSSISLNYTDSAQVAPIGNKIVLRNGIVITKNNSMEGMLAEFDPQHKFSRLIQPYPSKSEFGENFPDYAIFNFYIPFMGVSPDGNHFAISYAHGDILAFGQLVNDSIQTIFKIKEAPKGVVLNQVGEDSFSFKFNQDWINSYGAPTLSNEEVYIPWYDTNIDYFRQGKSLEDFVQQIRVYDFKGHLKRIILLPEILAQSIAVTEDGSQLFLLIMDADQDYAIYKLKL